jgi:hypothetical protein
MKYYLFDIEIVESQFDNNPLGVPDQGTPEEALQDFLNFCPNATEDCIYKGENEFIIWRDDIQGQYFANAWTVNPETGEREYLAYYEFKAIPLNKFIELGPNYAF